MQISFQTVDNCEERKSAAIKNIYFLFKKMDLKFQDSKLNNLC